MSPIVSTSTTPADSVIFVPSIVPVIVPLPPSAVVTAPTSSGAPEISAASPATSRRPAILARRETAASRQRGAFPPAGLLRDKYCYLCASG